jgi:ABC-type transport system substrate-binding protein
MNKLVVGSIVLVLVTCGWSTMSVGEQMPAPRGELHVVDKSPFNWQYIVLNVFEHLVEMSKDGTLVPGPATGWRWLDDRTLEMALRQGVTFHNGAVFDAEWGIADGTLRQLHDAVLRTVDRKQQQALIRQMERHTHDQAYFLFLYNPIQLYAVNKAVAFVPYVTMLNLAETSVTEQHWSVRKQKASTPE